MQPEPITIEYDKQADVVTIEGTRYHADLFRFWAQHTPITPDGFTFRVVEKADGVVTFEKVRIGRYQDDAA